MRLTLASLFLIAAAPVAAEPLRVVTDIAPVHSLVSQVMGDLGSPFLLLEASLDPHHVTLRPSQAQALADAEAIFWIGPALTPWLEKPLDTLSGGALNIVLTEVPDTQLIVRGEADHQHQPDDNHGVLDPHAWLDPDNAELWLNTIAEVLAGLDPAHAETYKVNAARAREKLDLIDESLSAQLAGLAQTRFVVSHDAYGYFARHFGIDLSRAISDSDAAPASAARLAALRDEMRGVACAFREPQQSPAALDTLLEGSNIPQATLDPLGSSLLPGPDLYAELLRAMADNISSCAAR